VFLLYFSASWCPPCKTFTPTLNSAYNKAIADGKKVKIVFISSDKSEAEYLQYYKEKMDFSRMAFESETGVSLFKEYEVKGIPCLVVLNKDGTLRSNKGREMV